MPRLLVLAAVLGLALPAAAQKSDSDSRIVVAEIKAEAIRPLLSPTEVAGFVAPMLADAARREGRRPQFEQSWIERGPKAFRLMVDAQFPDGDDFIAALPLEEVQEDGRHLLVLTRPRY
jgi:hypothetical protein